MISTSRLPSSIVALENAPRQLVASEQISRLQSGTSGETLVPSPDSPRIRLAEQHANRQVVIVDEIAFINTAEEQLC